MPSLSTLRFTHVHPWGVEPQSLEPESNILSIELWVHFNIAKVRKFFLESAIFHRNFIWLRKPHCGMPLHLQDGHRRRR